MAVGVDRLPQEHDLGEAPRHQALDLAHDVLGGRLTSGPRVRGTTQKLQTWLQPSIAVTKARTGFPWAVTSSGIANASALRSRSTATRPRGRGLVEQVRDAVEVVGADEDVDVAGALEQRLSLQLGHAAADADPQVRTLRLEAAEAPERVLELLASPSPSPRRC